MSFVADSLQFSLNHCKESESCAMMNFAVKETLPMRFALFSRPTPLRATSNSVSSRGLQGRSQTQKLGGGAKFCLGKQNFRS